VKVSTDQVGSRVRIVGYASLFDQAAMAPMLLRVSKDLHVHLTQIATVVAGYYFCYGAMQIFWGVYSSSHGYVRTIRIGLFMSATSTFICAVSHNYTILLIFRSISGAFLSAVIPAALSYIGSATKPDATHKQISGLMVATSFGTASSTVLSAAISWYYGWNFVFFLSAFISYVAFYRVKRLAEIINRDASTIWIKSLGKLFTHRPMQVLLFLSFIDGAALLGTLIFVPTFIESHGSSGTTAGAVTMIYGCTVLAVSLTLSKMKKRFALSSYILFGAGLATFACLILMFSASIIMAIIACCLLGTASATMHSSIQTWSTEVYPSRRSLSVSLFAGFLFLGSSFASQFNSTRLGHSQFTSLFGQGALLFLTISIFGGLYRRKLEKRSTTWAIS
jgi:MFS family permease